MQQLVERLAADEELVCFYDSVDAEVLVERLTLMFAPMLGSASAGSITDLDAAHGQPFTPTDEQWLRWSGHLMTLLCLRQLDDTTMQRFASLLSALTPASCMSSVNPTGSEPQICRTRIRGTKPTELDDP
ncbi:hypothetical protein [Cryptosporangium sp. NPDC048952]|uniref:hypothetical protein n=1 Tax=Cryptosporangium sp. NPDC048952 TaxID=3363961 RepID=UPI003714795A